MRKGKIVKCKPKFNPFTRRLMMNTGGFPDFIAFQHLGNGNFEVIGVEVKTNGLLSKEEKEKCRWLIDHDIFSEIWIARKKKEGRKVLVEYRGFNEKYGAD